MTLPREYQLSSPIVFAFIFGAIVLFIGLVFLLIKPWIGLLAILAAIGLPLAIWYLGTTYKIVCDERGISVDSASKRAGAKHQQVRWDEITQTRYFEIRGDRQDRRATQYFEGYKGDERLFKVGQGLKGFHDLIETFNSLATKVPYVWQKQAGFSAGIGVISVGRSAYVQVNRGQAVSSHSGPPPLAHAGPPLPPV